MVAIGGLTRLTESGLSITEWKPVHGIVPPFSEGAWEEEFSKYKLSPEYLKKNMGMSLEEFKGIFWLEFVHRLVGRITGFIFLLPLIYFLSTKQISKNLGLKLFGIFALGGFQGVVGWYMVKSGLQDAPHVSQYWLAFHLGMAFLIYGFTFQAALNIEKNKVVEKSTSGERFHPLLILSNLILLLVFIQVMLGALVAGMHAGLIYNTFPDMDGKFVPSGLMVMLPWYINFFENATTVQFTHRISAYLITLLIITLWVSSLKFNLTNKLRYAISFLPIVVVVQITLGVFTLLHNVPVVLASLHQVFALVLFSLVIFINNKIRNNY